MELVGIIILISGGLSIVGAHKHLINIIIGVEIISLSLVIMLIIYLTNSNEIFLLLILFTFIACEGALGLSILVGLIRSHGRDYFLRFRILRC